MRDPMSRKLFQNRDAREKLRGMGGIMASSPELAQTVARFQAGGSVEGPNTARLRELRGIGNSLAEMQAQTAIMQERMRRRNAAADERLDLLRFLSADAPAVDEFSGLPPTMTDPTVPVVSPTPTAPSGPVPVEPSSAPATPLTPEQEAALLELGISPEVASTMTADEINDILSFEDITETRRSEFDDVPYEPPEAGRSFFAETFMPGRAAEARTRAAASERRAEAAEADNATAADDRDAREATAATMEAEAEAADEEIRALDELEEARRRAAEELEQESDADGGGGGDGDGGRGDFDTTYEQMLSRLQNVMGTDDRDSREQAMANLAMIGLAIAAGQSPNALTNVAQGALAGMQGIQAAEARETEQERELRLEAMRLAADEVELGRRLESAERIAEMRASGTGGTSFSPTEPLVDAVRELAQSGLQQGLYEDLPSALAAAEAALSPLYGGQVPDVTVPTISTQAEYDALPPGSEFIQNGQRRRKPE